MSLDLYREDPDKQSSGSPCYISEMIFNVARIGTKKAQLQIAEIKEKLYGFFPNPKIIDENEVFANWLAYDGITGWDNVKDDENGEDLEFSRSVARMLFLNKSYWLSLNQILISHAANYENYLNDQLYEDVEKAKKL